MLIWILVAGAAAAGAPLLVVGAVALIAVHPVGGAVALIAAAFVTNHRRQRNESVDEVGFLRSIASSVSAGSTLRTAIRSGDPRIVQARTRRLCDAGMSLAKVGSSLRDAIPANGSTFAAVCSMSEHTGSSLAQTLHVLAGRAVDVANMRRHRVVASAQARFSAGIVGVAPLVVTIGLVVFRGVPGDGGPLVVIPMVAGAGLQLTGIVVVSVLTSRSLA